ncbi:MAG: L-histidine N(alpha)-methyltransferase [Prochlorococcaceae cyanobacterium ETNP18_MAG_14]|nr:L-histidine N(alpha)-methyltransferase [Prochlorococcaceae cyanobacterium ETNP18_MAG_14]
MKAPTISPLQAELINLHPALVDMRRMVCDGLRKKPRQLPAWLLYDTEGSRLFEQICEQPEYSLSRTETALLGKQAAAIATALESGVIVEFGAGSARKVGPLLRSLRPAAYIAIDISSEHLQESTNALQRQFPEVPILGICCDHSQLDALPDHPLLRGQRRIGFFPGSSLGNFEAKEAIVLLRNFRKLLNGGPLLLGLDHPKPKERMVAAYNDAAGVSAAFAHNLLHRLNHELEGDFDLDQFTYRASWQAEQSRVVMELVSKCKQLITVAGRQWLFTAGESLITEYSIKYLPEAALALIAEAGWDGVQRWHDPANEFSIHLLKPSNCTAKPKAATNEPSRATSQNQARA